LVIAAYGNNNNSLFYKHTLPGKVTAGVGAGARPVMVGGAHMKSVFDLDDKTTQHIQDKIDNWHKQYTDWKFYKNATRFFVENQELPKSELLSLKLGFDDVFDADKGTGLLKIVNDIKDKHDEINGKYATHGADIGAVVIEPTLVLYIRFFKAIFEDIEKHMPDTLNFTQSRENELGYKYKFDQSVKNDLFKIYSEIKNILDGFGDIQNVPYLKLVDMFQIFTQQINELNRRFPTQLKDIFHSNIANNDRVVGTREYYKTYKLIQYVYWLMRDTTVSQPQRPNPFDKNYDTELPDYVYELAGNPDDLAFEPWYHAGEYGNYKTLLQNPPHYEETEKERKDMIHYIDKVENDDNHIARLIHIYKNSVDDGDDTLKTFINDNMAFNPSLRSYRDIYAKNTIDLKFGIDLLFYVLYRVTSNVVSGLNKQKDLFDTVNDKSGKLFALRQEIQLKESKLTHMFDLISKQIGIPVERIMPDRATYYYLKTIDPKMAGLIETDKYLTAWTDKLELTSTGSLAKKIKYVTDKMTKGLDKALGLIDPTTPVKSGVTPADDENPKKMKAALVELLQHNTVQVVHMLFAKPRDIWYSPDMRTGTLTSASKWTFFRLEKPEIIAKSVFNELKKTWDVVNPASTPGRLHYILTKTTPLPPPTTPSPTPSIDIFEINIKDDIKPSSSMCVFLVTTQPSPQMLAYDKDSANEPRFQNPSFSLGGVEPSINDDHAVGSKLMQKLKEAIRPDPEKCNNVRGLIQEQATELSSITKDLFKAAGVDFSIKFAGLKNKIAAAALNRVMNLIIVHVIPTASYDISNSPPQPNVDEALSIAKGYEGDPDFDALRGFCEFVNSRREELKANSSANESKQYEGIDLIIESFKKKKSSPTIQLILALLVLIIKNNDYIHRIDGILNPLPQVGGGRRQIYVGGANNSGDYALIIQLLREAASKDYYPAMYVLVRMKYYDTDNNFAEFKDDEALTMIQSAASKEYASAEYLYAKILEEQKFGAGREFTQDDITALSRQYYKRAADQGHIDAAFKLAKIFYRDKGDPVKALQYFKSASSLDESKPTKYDYTPTYKEEANKQILEIKTKMKEQSDAAAVAGKSRLPREDDPTGVFAAAETAAVKFLDERDNLARGDGGGNNDPTGVIAAAEKAAVAFLEENADKMPAVVGTTRSKEADKPAELPKVGTSTPPSASTVEEFKELTDHILNVAKERRLSKQQHTDLLTKIIASFHRSIHALREDKAAGGNAQLNALVDELLAPSTAAPHADSISLQPAAGATLSGGVAPPTAGAAPQALAIEPAASSTTTSPLSRRLLPPPPPPLGSLPVTTPQPHSQMPPLSVEEAKELYERINALDDDITQTQLTALRTARTSADPRIIAVLRQQKSVDIRNSLIALAKILEQEQASVAGRTASSSPATATALPLSAVPSALPAPAAALPSAVPTAAASQSSTAANRALLISNLKQTRHSVLGHLTEICQSLGITPPDVRSLLSQVPAIQSDGKIDVRKFLMEDITIARILHGIETAITTKDRELKEDIKKYNETDTLFIDDIQQICEDEVGTYRDNLRSLIAVDNAITGEVGEIIETIKKIADNNPVLNLGLVSPDNSGVAAILNEFTKTFQFIHRLIVQQFMPKIVKCEEVVRYLDESLSHILNCVKTGFDEKIREIGEVLQKLKQNHASVAGIIAQIKGMYPSIE
jgi:hypothetical protein